MICTNNFDNDCVIFCVFKLGLQPVLLVTSFYPNAMHWAELSCHFVALMLPRLSICFFIN